ncbi:alpha/beta fold hydrolase [Rufibacter latericius]|uniref:Alpha/beta hydrolase n=1 Tax=Rufibacter latericius TaxID=2487040 RepID=A0A3M9MEI4_9BACT|nr:alpha/beta fold hydrolase [Rufibacter latericius]RNI23595.1 alpha/beta hydrolase [Rufibacter latericius]
MEPLLLLHGALGAKDQFEPLLPLLSSTVPVYSFNLAGHGGAPFPKEPFSIEYFVRQLLDWLDHHHLPRIQVFGYSMGGYIALEAARQQPDRFSRIFTLATKFHWTPETALHETAKLQPDIISSKVPTFAQVLQERHAPQDWTELLHRTSAMMHQLGQVPTLSSQAFAQINIPVCVAVGDRDQMVSIEESLEAYRQLPQGQFHVLPNTKHPLEQLQWPQLAQALQHFFSYA